MPILIPLRRRYRVGKAYKSIKTSSKNNNPGNNPNIGGRKARARRRRPRNWNENTGKRIKAGKR